MADSDELSAQVAAPAFDAERTKSFVDAVVAIAMTLLILPLVDSVTEVAGAGDTLADWWVQHNGQLQSFVATFVLIGLFWMLHHRLFARVTRVSFALLWLLMAWMVTIVWMPVAAAMLGRFGSGALMSVIYIGSLILVCLVSIGIRMYLRAHPDIHQVTPLAQADALAVDVAMVVLFAVALVIAVLVPAIGLYSLLIMFAAGFLQRGFARLFGVPRGAFASRR